MKIKLQHHAENHSRDKRLQERKPGNSKQTFKINPLYSCYITQKRLKLKNNFKQIMQILN